MTSGGTNKAVLQTHPMIWLVFVSQNPDDTTTSLACHGHVHFSHGSLTANLRSLELDVTENTIAFKNIVISEHIHFAPHDTDRLSKNRPGLRK